MAPLSALAGLLPGIPLTPPPPLPPTAPAPSLQRRVAPTPSGQLLGSSISINGIRQQALWLEESGELWLPLEVLEDQLGVSRSSRANGSIELAWFGQTVVLPADRQRSLEDEVAVPVSGLIEAVGVNVRRAGGELKLELPSRPLQAIRSRDQGISGRRVVFDLSAPALVRQSDRGLLISAEATRPQLEQLKRLGLSPSQSNGWLGLQIPQEGERLSLWGPWRLVLDLPAAEGSSVAAAPAEP